MKTPKSTSLLDIAKSLGTDVLPPGSGGGTVTSVAGRTGAVVLTTADIGGLGAAATHAATDFDPAGAAAIAQSNAELASEPALGNPPANGYALTSTPAGVRSWVLGCLLLSIPFFGIDDMESYSAGANNALSLGVSWAGIGSIGQVETNGADDMESYSAGANNALSGGINWATAGSIGTGETIGSDDMESYSVGANNALCGGTNWAGPGSIVYV